MPPEDDKPKLPQMPNRTYTSDEVKDVCISIKQFSEVLERQLIVGEMDAEREATINLHRWADKLQSLLP